MTMLDPIRSCMQTALKLTDGEAANIGVETTPLSVSGWTSTAHLELILALEGKFRITFDANEIAELASVASILKALERRGVE